MRTRGDPYPSYVICTAVLAPGSLLPPKMLRQSCKDERSLSVVTVQ